MIKRIDGVIVEDGREFLEERPNLYPVIEGFVKVLGVEVMNKYLHDCLGHESSFYPGFNEIGMGESKGWATLEDQVKLINYIMSKLSIDVGYNYKTWVGKYEHIICV